MDALCVSSLFVVRSDLVPGGICDTCFDELQDEIKSVMSQFTQGQPIPTPSQAYPFSALYQTEFAAQTGLSFEVAYAGVR